MPDGVWSAGGRLRVVFHFTNDGERVTAIELVADTVTIAAMQVVVVE